ncbi:uncharacterized protein [Rutidosis leptorrhynchoides]|uniref:uncharacterized protein isoform X2 n=1 Tax=Rutidosis leptorrhynchoides TaxID=125765 RepID=UPI003A9A58B2
MVSGRSHYSKGSLECKDSNILYGDRCRVNSLSNLLNSIINVIVSLLTLYQIAQTEVGDLAITNGDAWKLTLLKGLKLKKLYMFMYNLLYQKYH